MTTTRDDANAVLSKSSIVSHDNSNKKQEEVCLFVYLLSHEIL